MRPRSRELWASAPAQRAPPGLARNRTMCGFTRLPAVHASAYCLCTLVFGPTAGCLRGTCPAHMVRRATCCCLTRDSPGLNAACTAPALVVTTRVHSTLDAAPFDLVPMTFVFLTTADWSQPSRSARPLAFAAVALALAFAALYVLEHYR